MENKSFLELVWEGKNPPYPEQPLFELTLKDYEAIVKMRFYPVKVDPKIVKKIARKYYKNPELYHKSFIELYGNKENI